MNKLKCHNISYPCMQLNLFGIWPGEMTMMSFRRLILVLLFLCPLTSAQFETLIATACGATGNYTSDSPYGANLHSVLSNITSHNVGLNGFYRYSEGVGDDAAAYAYALCRGDTSQSKCSDCVKFAASSILLSCPNQRWGMIWYEYCTVSYGESYLYRAYPAVYYSTWIEKKRTNLSYWGSYLDQAPSGLLVNLSEKASMGDSSLKFAAGHANYTGTDEKIYALAQCVPDLDQAECAQCLKVARIEALRSFVHYLSLRVLLYACDLRISNTEFFDAPAETTPSSPPPPSGDAPSRSPNAQDISTPPSSQSSKGPNVFIIISVSVVGFLILTSLFVAFIFLKIKRRRQILRSNKSFKQTTLGLFASEDADEIKNVESLQFDFRVIAVATDYFADDNKLGEGGFGSVYKGKLEDGREIAVKRLAENSGQGGIEFKNEVLLVAKLQHKNLVRLLGFSLEGREMLLIYEFVPNASLDLHLFDVVNASKLDWVIRFKTIMGVARGLLYLHEDSRLTIIHRDLKASNILLDEEMNPKIADFGMARLFAMKQTQGTTYRIVGTHGYMAPEYAMHGTFSVKSDVYSFGVLLLEIVSGKRNTIYHFNDTKMDLISIAWENWKNGTVSDMIDRSIIMEPANEILRCIHIGLLCVQADETHRPTMASATLMLSSQSYCLPSPSEPACLVRTNQLLSEMRTNSGEGSGAKRFEIKTSSMTYFSDTSATQLEPR